MGIATSEYISKQSSEEMLYNHVCAKLSEFDMEVIRTVRPGGNWKDIPLNIAKKSARLRQIRASGGRTTYYGRLGENLPSYTINTYFNRPGNGTFIHPVQDRLISIREAARLQSFPDTYRFLGSTTSMYKQIGNAVPPLLAFAIGEQVKPGIVVDLFSGAGGLSEGLSQAGHSVILASDFNPKMCETHKHNHPETTVICSDLSKEDSPREIAEEIDVASRGKNLRIIAGGPPCQGFSTAGKWNSLDARNQLFLPFMEVVERMMPDYVLIENVPGIQWMKNGGILKNMLSILNGLEYATSTHLLRAEEYGVPQRRRRVFILGSRKGAYFRPPLAYFYSLECGKRRSETLNNNELASPVTVGEAIMDLPPIPSGGGVHVSNYERNGRVSMYQSLMRGRITRSKFLEGRARED
ncbi:MAG: DNA (cytosine-5-)-methyltransferase [Candidatus Thorarchaeota archaeon]